MGFTYGTDFLIGAQNNQQFIEHSVNAKNGAIVKRVHTSNNSFPCLNLGQLNAH